MAADWQNYLSEAVCGGDAAAPPLVSSRVGFLCFHDIKTDNRTHKHSYCSLPAGGGLKKFLLYSYGGRGVCVGVSAAADDGKLMCVIEVKTCRLPQTG